MFLIAYKNKNDYISFYKKQKNIPIFSSPWWLDSVCGEDSWDVILVKDSNNVIKASFPFYIQNTLLGNRITMPVLTQKLGTYILYDYDDLSITKKIGYENEINQVIIDALPKVGSINISFNQDNKNWLQYFWNGFMQKTNYSYKIHDIKNKETINNLYKNIKKYKKYDINKLKEFFIFKYDLSFDAFYKYFENAINDRYDSVSIPKDKLRNLVFSIKENKQGDIFYVTDRSDNICATSLTVWDNDSAYYLMSMRDSKNKTTGSTEFMVYNIIEYVSMFANSFDFEGSMMKGVEKSYRYYGSNMTEYYNISKNISLRFKIYEFIKSLFK